MKSNLSRTPGLKSRISRRSGLWAFSLVEVTLALAILAFALVGIVGLMPVGLRAMGDALDDTASSLVARRLMGEVRQSSLDAILANPMNARFFDAEGQEVPGAGDPFAIYQTTVVATAASSPNLVKIKVLVARNGGYQPGRSFVSYVARH